MRAVLGVDGCPGGWVAARVDERGAVTWHAGSFAALLAVPCDLVAVDVPIGLPTDGRRRAADVVARALLGPQRSSVFHTPPRAVLAARSHAEATALSRAAGSVGVSVQTYGILHAVREVDAAVRDAPVPVVEVHPEVSLRRLAEQVRAGHAEAGQAAAGQAAAGQAAAGQAPAGQAAAGQAPVRRGLPVELARKRRPEGQAQRLEVLRGWLPDLQLPTPRPGQARPDDCLDACAAAWSGWRWLRGEAEVLGDEVDATGLPMRIVV